MYDGVTMSALGRVAALWNEDDAGNRDIWRLDVETDILSRLTTHSSDDVDAALSPDERRLAFSSWRLGRRAIFVKDLTTGNETLLHNPTEMMPVDTWARDGRHVIARMPGRAVFSIPVDGDRTPVKIADTPFSVDEIHVSPDGQMVAFNSSESGRNEVYVARFPSFSDKRQLSRGGGVQPLWRGDGRELFYLSPDASVMSVRLDAGPAGRPGPTQRLFGTNVEADSGTPDYAVTPDGQRFLLLDRGPRQPDRVHVLLNWLRPDG